MPLHTLLTNDKHDFVSQEIESQFTDWFTFHIQIILKKLQDQNGIRFKTNTQEK